ncbi:uncharacterized protein THITE_2050653 [Thermothielavioides terrestris NRRL 8126]|uniref:Uncharacterized protein n=1 Tax=Thermothielavioides terrestris (strain ATCC 38088 / NRRL 8126) TaxID=578455 RepID=G2R770_THETT|nr:uncharacterized protein THITE_2050653 [Thermothielavioides terrestris NRRL 8126]AEO67779.1 hypothetical protein THITE_2050653 [Thermothielavioides terrestris NRRL 8126]
MAAATPSALFQRLANAWRLLALRSDVDDIVLELLGRFSLERIYASASDRVAYQHLVIALLSQLKTIFDIQRLTIPSENAPLGRHLGFLVSWEVGLRSVEFVLQTIAEGRESLWEHRKLRDKYLAEFLLSALRVLSVHPKTPSNQRARDRRERFARIHGALEQVFDSYPGPKSFSLEVCKEVAAQLHADPDVLMLPPKLRSELPNLASELVRDYPLPPCLQPPSIAELAPPGGFGNWLAQLLALRDVAQFVLAASVQYAANGETRDVRLQAASAKARNAVLTALDNLRTPPGTSKVDMVAIFSTTFRTILPDTIDLSSRDVSEPPVDECELDALDALCTRLRERQVTHRVSDREAAHSISQVIENILAQDDPGGRHTPARPGLYVVNCPRCHLAGASQLRSSGAKFPPASADASEIRLPPDSKCAYCKETITLAREVSVARRTWELVRPLLPDADTINVERHLPTQFQLGPPKPEAHGLPSPGYSSIRVPGSERHREPELPGPPHSAKAGMPSPTFGEMHPPGYPGLVSPQSPSMQPSSIHPQVELPRPGAPVNHGRNVLDEPEHTLAHPDPTFLSDPPPFSRESPAVRGQAGEDEAPSIHTPRTVPIPASAEKGKSRWRFMFTGSKKAPTGASGDSSSLSSSALEAQKLEEISLSALLSTPKTHARGKPSKNINVCLSQNSTLALFWTQLLIHVLDVSTSPPTMVRAILPESTCILAAVGKSHLAYIIGTRDHKLTLRIVNLMQTTTTASVMEYRIPSPLWCKSMAIDKQENYVVVGFEDATVRFFNVRSMEQPREDRLHAATRHGCRTCPPVDTLAFSSDGLVLLASMRSPKTGWIQTYSWRFPFHTFQELTACRYQVPLHESEDNGVSAAIFRPGTHGEEDLVCITTWTQSGTPVLIQPHDGHRAEIRTELSGRHSKLGNRVQCAAFSPSGRELVLVNDKGHVFQVSNLNSSPMDVRRIANTKELTAKSDSFAMSFMTWSDEEHVVLAWADSSRAVGWVRKIPMMSRNHFASVDTPGLIYETSSLGGTRELLDQPRPPIELAATERTLTVGDGYEASKKLLGEL